MIEKGREPARGQRTLKPSQHPTNRKLRRLSTSRMTLSDLSSFQHFVQMILESKYRLEPWFIYDLVCMHAFERFHLVTSFFFSYFFFPFSD